MVWTDVCSRAQVMRVTLQGPPTGRPTSLAAFLGLDDIRQKLSPLSLKRLFPSLVTGTVFLCSHPFSVCSLVGDSERLCICRRKQRRVRSNNISWFQIRPVYFRRNATDNCMWNDVGNVCYVFKCCFAFSVH